MNVYFPCLLCSLPALEPLNETTPRRSIASEQLTQHNRVLRVGATHSLYTHQHRCTLQQLFDVTPSPPPLEQMESFMSGMLASCSPACQRLEASWRSTRRQRPVRMAAVRSGKRAKYASGKPAKGGSSSGQLLEVQPDASDAWRLEAVLTCLQDGGVSSCPGFYAVN